MGGGVPLLEQMECQLPAAQRKRRRPLKVVGVSENQDVSIDYLLATILKLLKGPPPPPPVQIVPSQVKPAGQL